MLETFLGSKFFTQLDNHNLKQFRNIELVALQPRGDSFENRNCFEIFIKLYLGGQVSYEV